MKKDFIGNQHGQTLVEAIIGFALITVVGLAFTGGMVSLRNTTKHTVLMSTTEKQISDIAENIKAGVENYQVNFVPDSAGEDPLDLDKLPMAWDNGVSMPKDDCETCAGRYGYTIQQYNNFRGLYKVTLRMTHTSWAAKGEKSRDYIFVVSAK